MNTNNVQLVLKGVVRSLRKEGVDAEELLPIMNFMQDMHVDSINRDGNFTTVIVADKSGHSATGVSKRNPNDEENQVRGEMLATSRAVKNAIIKFLAKQY